MTAKRILWGLVALIVVVWIVYLGSSKYDASRSSTSGEVYSNDPPAGKNKTSTNSGSDADTKVVASPPIVYPAPGQTVATTGTADPYAQTPMTGQTAQPGSTGKSAAGSVPATDSIDPEPPNGMVFSGSGKYQLYRQGDITWRLDTGTGRTCILFATDEEWKKPRVLKAGCGRS